MDRIGSAGLPRRLSTQRWFGPVVVTLATALVASLATTEHLGAGWWCLNVGVAVSFGATWALFRTDPVRAANAAPCLAATGAVAASNAGVGYVGPEQLIAFLSAYLIIIPIAVLLLRYPLSRIPERVDRVYVLVLAGWVVGSQLALAVLWTPARHRMWWPTLVRGNHLLATANDLQAAGSAVLALIGLYLVGRRVWRGRGLDRLELVPVGVAGALLAVGLGVASSYGQLATDPRVLPFVSAVVWTAFMLTPLTFLVVAVQHRLARARVADLSARIGAPHQPATGPQGLRAELRRALSDPGLEIVYWVDGQYVDSHGAVADPDEPGGDRISVPISGHDGEPLAILLGDPNLRRHRDLVDSAVATAALALENARLHAAVLVQLGEVRTAQYRIVEAGLVERRRLERDLHDGAQQRLLGASMTLARAQQAADPAPLLRAAQEQVRRALAELRDLARGIHPAVLTQSGLAAAVESLSEHAPLPICIDIPPRRWPAAVEATGYFVIAEGLANAAKHAPGSTVTVTVTVTVTDTGHALRVEIVDDGPGGADRGAGSGLGGLADRVQAVGGTLEIRSVPGRGTEVEAVIPCG